MADTVRPAAARMLTVALTALAILLSLTPGMASASGGSITGVVFHDADRDGSRQAHEDPFVDHLLYLFDANGDYVRNTRSGPDGTYAFHGLADGRYRISSAPSAWWELWNDWVPTTTGSLQPRHEVTVSGGVATADFGWRPIVRSDDLSAPMTTFEATSGLTVRSYNDVVTAEEVHDRLMTGDLIGAEAAHTTILHDSGSGTSCSISAGRSDGVWATYRATCNIAWNSWLTGAERSLFHEYGHAWSLYHAYLVQQDRDLLAYLEARGIDPNDQRLESSHAWSRRELIAEDYRQLFGSPEARLATQENRDLPRAVDVDGLEAFLREVFTVPPAADEPPPDDEAPPDDSDGSDGVNEDGSEPGSEEPTDGGTTLAPAPDAPVTIASPAEGNEVAGDLEGVGTVTAEFTRVDVHIAGQSKRATLDGAGNWTVAFSRAELTAGDHVLEVSARGPRGRQASASITVRVTGEDPATSPKGNGPRRR